MNALRTRLTTLLADWRVARHHDDDREPCVYSCRVCHVLDDVECIMNETYLIAAAPDLLAALKAILAGFETGIFCRNTEGDHLSEWAIHAAPAIAALAVGQRAVAKAEGR